MQGLSEPELAMLELLESVLERFRWLQVLAHTQSYLLREKLRIPQEELDRVLEAASRTVDRDAQQRAWNEEFARIKSGLLEGRRGIQRERKQMRREERDEKSARRVRQEGGGSA